MEPVIVETTDVICITDNIDEEIKPEPISKNLSPEQNCVAMHRPDMYINDDSNIYKPEGQ